MKLVFCVYFVGEEFFCILVDSRIFSNDIECNSNWFIKIRINIVISLVYVFVRFYVFISIFVYLVEEIFDIFFCYSWNFGIVKIFVKFIKN